MLAKVVRVWGLLWWKLVSMLPEGGIGGLAPGIQSVLEEEDPCSVGRLGEQGRHQTGYGPHGGTWCGLL